MGMDSAKHNFGEAEKIRTEAIGVAGKRIFRILIDCPTRAAATLWLEKEQVYGLSMAMKKMAGAKEPEGRANPDADFPDVAEADSAPLSPGVLLEFKVSRLGLAYGPGESRVTVFFYDECDEVSEGEEEYEAEAVSPPALQVNIGQAQMDEFITQSLDECASGRGTDALSRHAMVATGKVDPNTNGHFHH